MITVLTLAVGWAWQLMTDNKTDFMNLTLYTLTLITALATPLIFLTGLFGMNFADMDELVLTVSMPWGFMLAHCWGLPMEIF